MSSLRNFVGLVLGLFLGLTASRAAVAVGDSFPDLSSLTPSAGVMPATEGKVTLVDFWASWCAPCEASFPALARLHADYGAKGLVIVAVSVDEKPAAFAAFVKKRQPPFTTVLDARQTLVKKVHVPAMPTSYLLGRDGRVRFIHAGFHGASTEAELRRHIEGVMAEDTLAKP